ACAGPPGGCAERACAAGGRKADALGDALHSGRRGAGRRGSRTGTRPRTAAGPCSTGRGGPTLAARLLRRPDAPARHLLAGGPTGRDLLAAVRLPDGRVAAGTGSRTRGPCP